MSMHSIFLVLFRWLRLRCRSLRAWWRRQHTRSIHRRKSAKPARKIKLEPKPRSGGRAKPGWVVAEILLAWDCGCKSYRQIANEFNRRHAYKDLSICHNTVHAWVRKYRTEMLAVQLGRLKNRVPRLSPPNLRWCVDATGREDKSGQRHFAVGIVDHGSRLSIQLKRMVEQTCRSAAAGDLDGDRNLWQSPGSSGPTMRRCSPPGHLRRD